MSSVIKSAVVIGLLAIGAAQMLAQRRAAVRAPEPGARLIAPSEFKAVEAKPQKKQKLEPGQAAALGMATLEPGRNGHYEARVETRGGAVNMLVDTGASFVALTAEDARAIGVFPHPDAPKVSVSTANGVAAATRVSIESIRIGSITVYDVPALVMEPGASSTSLLGMSFLKKLGGYEVAQGRLIMRQ